MNPWTAGKQAQVGVLNRQWRCTAIVRGTTARNVAATLWASAGRVLGVIVDCGGTKQSLDSDGASRARNGMCDGRVLYGESNETG